MMNNKEEDGNENNDHHRCLRFIQKLLMTPDSNSEFGRTELEDTYK